MIFTCRLRLFTAIEHCIPTCSRCGTTILGTNWTPIGCSMQRADLGWNNRYFHNSRKFEFHLRCLPGYFSLTSFVPSFALHLTSCYARYFLRKHLCKIRSLTVRSMILSMLKVVLLPSTLRLLTPQSSKQLMVRELFAQFISLQQTWTKNLPMFADADVEISEPILPDITGVSSAVPSLQIEATTEKVLYLILLVHSIINWPNSSNQDFHYTLALDPLAWSYSFNLEEYFDEDEIRSSATSSNEALSEETRNQLRNILPIFESNIADLVQDTYSTQRVFLSIKGNPSPVLSRVLSSLSVFEDQAL